MSQVPQDMGKNSQSDVDSPNEDEESRCYTLPSCPANWKGNLPLKHCKFFFNIWFTLTNNILLKYTFFWMFLSILLKLVCSPAK